MRQDGLVKESEKLQSKIDQQEKDKKRFCDDVFECLHNIGDFKKLKKGAIRLYKTHVIEAAEIAKIRESQPDDKNVIDALEARRMN